MMGVSVADLLKVSKSCWKGRCMFLLESKV